MGAFTWADLIKHLNDSSQTFRTDAEREAYRIEKLEWVVNTMLEKLRDEETAKQAQFVQTTGQQKD